jgi:uroporphyrin-3 C-methyltransferase
MKQKENNSGVPDKSGAPGKDVALEAGADKELDAGVKSGTDEIVDATMSEQRKQTEQHKQHEPPAEVAGNTVSMDDEHGPASDSDSHSKTRTPSCVPQILVACTLLLLVMAAGAYYLWQEGRIQRMELERSIGDAQETAQQQWQQRLLQKETQIDKLQQQQQELQDSVTRVHQLASRNSQDWVLAEVEYLLLIANHRLQLEQDIETATTALRLADERLRDLANPELTRVRGEIARELEALHALVMPDYNGLALRLDALSEKVVQLGTRAAHPQVEEGQAVEGQGATPEAAPEEKLAQLNWREISEGLWNELRTLVVIRKHDQNILPMLTAEQEHSLRQGLRMKLETSRARLLQKNEEGFVLEMQGARRWLEEYFDTEDQGVMEMKASMEELMQARLSIEMPDISGSLTSLRAERK